MPASSPATRPATGRGSTSSRRRCVRRTPSSSPSRRCCSCSRWPGRRTTSSSSTPRRSSTGRCSPCCGQTDQLLMLCGLDVPTLKNVKLSLRTLEMLGFPAARTSLVLNRVTPKVGLTKEDVEGVTRPRGQLRDPERPGRGPAVNRGAAAALVRERLRVRPGSRTHRALARAGRRAGRRTRAVEAPKRRWLTPRRVLEGRAS